MRASKQKLSAITIIDAGVEAEVITITIIDAGVEAVYIELH